MPLFGSSKKKADEEAAAAEGAEELQPPNPLRRPGTSGTENLLISSRREASENFQRAQRAERAYRAKKHAEWAQQQYVDMKTNFREGFSKLWQGFRGLFVVARALPYLMGHNKEERRRKAEARQREKHLEQKRKLEEALAKAEKEGGGADGENKGGADGGCD